MIRSRLTDHVTVQYFIPALTVKFIGAIALGFIYQFYYGSGDTFNFHTNGSRVIWEAFMDDPLKGWSLMTHNDSQQVGAYQYVSRIIFFHDPQSFAVIRLSAFFDLFTFSSYVGTALLFCMVSFIGVWLLFKCFYDVAPHLHRQMAIAVLFIPSVVFWGSGILKDTITLGCLGIATYCVYTIFVKHKFSVVRVILLVVSLYIIYAIKIYILLVFLPAAIVWVLMFHYRLLNSIWVKIVMFPIAATTCGFLGYFAVLKAGEDNSKYSLDNIAVTAYATAYDIRYWSGRDAGSGYTLGELDGSWSSMIKLAPAAVNVSLFRPYVWESKNILMLISALESLALLCLTLYTIFVARMKFIRAFSEPVVMACIIFSLTFAFSVGVSTFNFGTLMRYKIPLLPFYAVTLILILDYAKRQRNFERFDSTENS
jgi:hypothetical protein